MSALARRFIATALACALAAPAAQAGEISAALGVFTLSDGLDLQASYRPEHSPWQLGYRFVRWTEGFEFAGTGLTETTTTQTGPLVNYLFRPEARGSWYVGVALLHWTQEEKSVRTGTRDKASTFAPFFGGGYRRRLNGSLYYNVGLYLSPAKLTTQTADSTEESTGADIQVQLGVAF
jgi:hypothetical protein